jgi:hypothetical protein
MIPQTTGTTASPAAFSCECQPTGCTSTARPTAARANAAGLINRRPEIVPVSTRIGPPEPTAVNSRERGMIEIRGFARKSEIGRSADRRLATAAFRPPHG